MPGSQSSFTGLEFASNKFSPTVLTVFYILLTAHPFIILYIKPNWCTIFLSMFISFLYMFRANMHPSSGEINVSMRQLVFVTLRE